MKDTILIAVLEPLIVKGLKYSLEQEGYTVDTAYNENEMVEKTGLNEYKLIIIDASHPAINKLDIYQTVRKNSSTQIIVLTADEDEMNKVIGLERGAYEFITKPINMGEIKSRVKAAIMKADSIGKQDEGIIKLWDITIDTLSRKVTIGNRDVDLSSREFDILTFLGKNKNRVYSREQLLKTIWGNDYSGDRRIVDVHIRRLREKLEPDPSNPSYIMTKWGAGYYLNG